MGSLDPDLLERGEERGRSPQGRAVSGDDLLSTAPNFGDEGSTLEDGHVFLDGRKAHGIPTRDGRHRFAAIDGVSKNVAPGRIRECLKQTVELPVVQRAIYNHIVVD